MRAPAAKRAAPVVPGRYIVVLEDGTSAADVPGRARGLARKHGGQEEQIYRHALKGFAARGLSQAAAARLRNEPGVKLVEAEPPELFAHIVKLIIEELVEGVPAILPSLKVNPCGSDGLISQDAT